VPIPSARRVVNVAPDANGHTLVEDWSGDLSRWDENPEAWGANPNHNLPLRAIRPNDGAMGGAYLRLGANDLVTAHSSWTQTLALFDQTQPITTKFRFRYTWASHLWAALGLPLYNGEAIYDGLTSEAAGSFGMYQNFFALTSGDIVDVEQEWAPATWTLRTRVAKNGGAWSGWNTHTNSAHIPLIYNLSSARGASALWPTPAPYFISFTGARLDLGAVRIAGVPMWGAEDFMGWDETAGWTLTGAGYVTGDDGSNVLGGLTGRESNGLEFIDHNLFANWGHVHSGASITADWLGQSPIVGLASGCRYKDLSFHAYNVGADRLRIRVRDAATGALLPDAQVPGNSTGIISSAPAVPAADHVQGATSGYVGRLPLKLRCDSPGTQRISLAGVPEGTEVYLEVEGHADASDGTYVNQARLGFVSVSFEPPATTTTTTTAAPTTTTTPAPGTTTTTAAPTTGSVIIGGARLGTDLAGALRLKTSQGVVGLKLGDTAGAPVRLETSGGRKGLLQ
jgi:hypothetical protein